ncbi:MAG TPA: pyruvate kinase [Caldisericia bacterium]|nr:pyruvate kinase [Caldisericia bacterium]HOL82949.1 pyruvate kinase [Caldisericia bacterium]HPC56533.1 pyruvate kinase [Caldisericia bacterium]HPP42985.1 pyruvate kinase [Caldisericia bacterium]HRT37383.1 pyruvate kinase [Caldisericia bacterium]
MKKTKIVATLGPSTDNKNKIKKLIKEGVDIFRLNLSHGDHSYHRNLINLIREIDRTIPILIDLCGPKLRIGKFENNKIFLKKGDNFTLTTKKIMGNNDIVSISYKDIDKKINKNDLILLDDGRIKLKVVDIKDKLIITKVIVGGELSDNKGVNIIGKNLSIPSLTDKDKDDIDFGIKERVDFIALSFVKTKDDIVELKDILKRKNYQIPVVAKIEKKEAIRNLKQIIDISDGIMVARGDLGVEMPLEEVSILQKKIIKECLLKGKFSILATQILESMVEKSSPTRAEVSDITNAIFDGADSLMLSSETATGKHPEIVIRTMKKISERVEKELPYLDMILSMEKNIKDDTILSICYSAVLLSIKIKAKIIVVTTETGRTAINVSRFRPKVPILTLTPNDNVVKILRPFWGVITKKTDRFYTQDDIISSINKEVRELDFIKKGDLFISLSGVIPGIPGGTNMIKVDRI